MWEMPPEMAILGWVIGGGISVLLAILWLLYLNKIVLNDEGLQEQIRAARRMREEVQRANDEKMRRAKGKAS